VDGPGAGPVTRFHRHWQTPDRNCIFDLMRRQAAHSMAVDQTSACSVAAAVHASLTIPLAPSFQSRQDRHG
jgi:hypothetical protein